MDTRRSAAYISTPLREERNDVPLSARIRKNLYKDSVTLMRVAQAVLARPGVRRATLLMGTPANKDILAAAQLDAAALADAGPSDVMIAVEADTAAALDAAQAEIEQLLEGQRPEVSAGSSRSHPACSIALAHARDREAVLAQISVPGPYAAAEALKALRLGLDVFLFSDNVPIAQERALKELARDKGLLVMGPDCGTAILDGVPIGFANVVRRGPISLVGASGTGLQEVTCRIHALGSGVRHAIGTGGRDLSEEVGGITMCQAIDLLARDDATRVVVLVSKPPAPATARKVLSRVAAAGKPCVVLFLGADPQTLALAPCIVPVGTLADAAATAVALVDDRRREPALPFDEARAGEEASRLARGQRYVRALYSGGTFCTEAQILWRAAGLRVHSNAPLDAAAALPDGGASRDNTALDLGADEFTLGRPHPMIDPTLRIERIAQEARDPATAAIVLDVVLGYGAHDDPAGALAPVIVQAKDACAREGRHLAVIAFVCGTDDDPQSLTRQRAQLDAAGALVLPDSTAAARFAAALARHAALRRPAAALAQG
jgi:succinyl-CoA synthetase alpha subunit